MLHFRTFYCNLPWVDAPHGLRNTRKVATPPALTIVGFRMRIGPGHTWDYTIRPTVKELPLVIQTLPQNYYLSVFDFTNYPKWYSY